MTDLDQQASTNYDGERGDSLPYIMPVTLAISVIVIAVYAIFF